MTPTLTTAHSPPLALTLGDADAATRFATIFAEHLGPQDCVLLSGPVGAGKSHFARVVIRYFLGAQTEVPSPTFTLVQVYSAAFDIWHADLYRLTSPGETEELGLEYALGQSLCLIEWPDRLGPRQIPNAVDIAFAFHGEGRIAQVRGASPALAAALRAEFAL